MSTRLPALLLAVAALAAGCAGEDDEPAPAPETATATARAYLVRDERVAPVAREVPAAAPLRGALAALLEGPTAGEESALGATTAIPAGTRLLDVALDDEVATVDLSGAFDDGGGSLSMLLRVAQVVHTATQFPNVERVRFRIEGEPVEAIGGEGVVVDPPVGRADFEEQAPLILVESPLPGATVVSPLRLRGSANTFEATFQVELLDADGDVAAKRFVTATSGTGTRGTFDATLPFDVPAGPATLATFELSAEDGSRIHEQRIPLVAGG